MDVISLHVRNRLQKAESEKLHRRRVAVSSMNGAFSMEEAVQGLAAL